MGRISGFIDRYINSARQRYHTPGHKGELCPRDITEIGDGGCIFPADVIRLAEKDCADIYKVNHLRFLLNGSSIGIKAALYPFGGKKVLYAAGVHIAFTYACKLFGVNAVCMSGENTEGVIYTCGCNSLPEPATYSEVEEALSRNPDAAAVFITSPDYLGRCAEIGIAELCREKGVALIADSAHGAHFAFAEGLDCFGFESVADICNMSAHKTLGAYTQTALLAVNNGKLLDGVDFALDMLGTTSPNYVLYESLENAVLYADGHRKEYLRLRDFTQEIRREYDVLSNCDYTRLCVKPARDPQSVYDALTERGVYCEAVIGGCLVFILTPFDTCDKLNELKKILAENL